MFDVLDMRMKVWFSAQPPIVILRQGMVLIAYALSGSWYGCKEHAHSFRSLAVMTFFAAMRIPSGGKILHL